MVNEANSLRTLDGTVVLLKTDPVAKWLVLAFAILSTTLALSTTILSLHFWKVRKRTVHLVGRQINWRNL